MKESAGTFFCPTGGPPDGSDGQVERDLARGSVWPAFNYDETDADPIRRGSGSASLGFDRTRGDRPSVRTIGLTATSATEHGEERSAFASESRDLDAVGGPFKRVENSMIDDRNVLMPAGTMLGNDAAMKDRQFSGGMRGQARRRRRGKVDGRGSRDR